MHVIVRGNGEVESNGIVFWNGGSQEQANIGDSSRVHDVYMIDSTGLFEVGDDRLSRDEETEGEIHFILIVIISRVSLIILLLTQSIPLETIENI